MSEVQKLVGTGRMGDFVHNGQTMAKAEGFKCVSKLWWDKTKPISAGIDDMAAKAKNREDIRCVAHDMRPIKNGVGEVVLEYKDGRQFKPTEHSWRQIANNFGAIPQTTINWFNGSVENFGFNYSHNEQAADVLLALLKYGHERMKVKGKDSRFLFRTYNDGTLRAVLTSDYAIIDNAWYLNTINDIFKGMGQFEPRLSHWKGDADTIYGNILLPDTVREDKDSDYGGMVSISNCEIGIRVMGNRPSIFRAICMNGCIWDETRGCEIRQVHRGRINLVELKRKIFDNINKQIPLIKSGVDKFLATKDLNFDPKVIRRGQVFTEVGLTFKVTPKIMRETVVQFKHYEGGNDNLFGVINSLTRAGQVKTSPKEWYDTDVVAGQLMSMNQNKWDQILNRAKERTPEEINEYLQLA